MPKEGITAVIDGKKYAVEEWGVQQPGRLLKEEWTEGFTGGMGQPRITRQSARNRYHQSSNMDMSTYPYMRLRPRSIVDELAVANLDPTNFPVYTFIAEDSGGEAYLYILNGRRAFKIKISDGTLESAATNDFGASAVCGRPALFNGVWYVPCANSVDYQSLDTVATTGNGDTWSAAAAGEKALHFAVGTKGAVAQLARAEINSKISFTSDPTSAAAFGASFDVGEQTTEIVDMHTWKGEYAIVKLDSVYRSDSDGNSHPIQGVVTPNITPAFAYHGGNSFVHSAYFYWPHISGLWRMAGDTVIDTIGFEAEEDWHSANQGEQAVVIGSTFWTSFGAYGRWAYAVSGLDVMYGRIRDDGSILWHGRLWQRNGSDTGVRIAVTDDNGPMLWIFATTRVSRIQLELDGSVRTRVDEGDDRGEASMSGSNAGYGQLGEVDFGDRTKNKQLRKFAVMLENWTAEATLTLNVFRDHGNSTETVGASITSGNYVERYWTPGTNDLARYITPYVKITTSGSYAPATEDPRISGIWIEAATPSIYRIVLVLTSERMEQGSVASAHQLLRNLIGKDVTLKEPELGGAKDQWTGTVLGYQEDAVFGDKADTGWTVTLFVERYDYGS